MKILIFFLPTCFLALPIFANFSIIPGSTTYTKYTCVANANFYPGFTLGVDYQGYYPCTLQQPPRMEFTIDNDRAFSKMNEKEYSAKLYSLPKIKLDAKPRFLLTLPEIHQKTTKDFLFDKDKETTTVKLDFSWR